MPRSDATKTRTLYHLRVHMFYHCLFLTSICIHTSESRIITDFHKGLSLIVHQAIISTYHDKERVKLYPIDVPYAYIYLKCSSKTNILKVMTLRSALFGLGIGYGIEREFMWFKYPTLTAYDS